MERDEWQSLIEDSIQVVQASVEAHTFRKELSGASGAVLLACSDGGEYVVKSVHSGRMPVNDRSVALLAQPLAAPVPSPILVDVPAALIANEPKMKHMTPGMGHGLTWLPGHSEREGLSHAVPENRDRFLRLALLYGWVQSNDDQFIYENAPPHLVSSVDHGHFFPNGPNWTVDTLRTAGPPHLHPSIVSHVGAVTPQEEADLAALLEAVDDDHLVGVIGSIPQTWGLSIDERVALAMFLSVRRDQLVASLRHA